MQEPNGKIKVCNPMVIRRGDFADVTVVFDITSSPCKAGRELRINLSMDRIILLKAKAHQAGPSQVSPALLCRISSDKSSHIAGATPRCCPTSAACTEGRL